VNLVVNEEDSMNTATAGINPERLIQSDQNSFPHPVTEIRLIETHISWILLTGQYAYKIKKPVRYDFVDYSELSQRRHFCLAELELNRRYAAGLYEDVVPIYLVSDRYWFGELGQKSGTLLDYAVKMKQFSQSALIASRLNSDELTAESVEKFGHRLAIFHQSIIPEDTSRPFGNPGNIASQVEDNFVFLRGELAGSERERRLQRLQEWSEQEFQRIRPLLTERKKLHFVRQCHGDLHLKNIIQLPDGELLPFDGIEFNDAFQWNDIVSEVAFPFMDFCARGRSDLGWRFFNAWMEQSEDYVALELIRFYTVYRAMVRAKVTWLNPAHHSQSSINENQFANYDSYDTQAGPWDRYLGVAEHFAFGLRPQLVITHGFSGSGKSFQALRWIEQRGGIRLRTDAIRQTGCQQLGLSRRYSPAINRWVYGRVFDLARRALQNRINAVVDGTFLRQQQRADFQGLAEQLGVPFRILDCTASYEELKQRIVNRRDDPSEASVAVLDQQIKSDEPLTSSEQVFVFK
jgi:aminoglycoside phosphotransferase family enzyme/predicted kinase